MQKYLQYVLEFHENKQLEIDFINNHLKKHLETNPENQDEIEQILDDLFSNKIDISKIGYKTLLEKTMKWHKKLQQVSTKKDETEGVDYEVFLDFKDGFQVVTLKSKASYEREGKLMSHCVASYYGRSSKIYSLRDCKNMPHCTIEEWQQIKGKGDAKIDPKYIDYIVKFLEKIGMRVGENEMKNLWYFKLETIDKDLTCEKQYNGYVCEKNLDQVKDKEGKSYKGFGLWNVQDVVEIKDDGKFRLYDDIKTIVEYSKIVNKESTDSDKGKEYAKIGSFWHYAQIGSSWDYAKIGSSWHSAKIGSSWDSAQIGSSWDSAQIGSSWHYAKIGSSWHYAKIGSSWDSAQISSSWDYAQIDVTGKYCIASNIGYQWKIKGAIGTWIVLAEYKKNEEWFYTPIACKTAKIDGKKLKENVWYTLKNNKIIEAK